MVDSSKEGTRVCEDSEVDDLHLNDISENIGRCAEYLDGRASGSRSCCFVMPSKWHLKGSFIRCISTNKIIEMMLLRVSKTSYLLYILRRLTRRED